MPLKINLHLLIFTFSATQLLNYSATSCEFKLLEEFENTIASENIIEKEALIYIAGYVAHRFRKTHPSLGSPTKSLSLIGDSWLGCISRGNCIYPADDFLRAAEVMDAEFIKFHGPLLNKESKIFDKLTAIILQKISGAFPQKVIACLVRTRTYIRLRNQNLKIKQDNCTLKNKKKTKHMTNKIMQNL